MAEPTITLPISLVQQMVNLLESDPGYRARASLFSQIKNFPINPGKLESVHDDPVPDQEVDKSEEA